MTPKTDCFIRLNTPELREWLRNIGIDVCLCCTFEECTWLTVSEYGSHGIGGDDGFGNDTHNMFLDENTMSIDCGTNVELFKALAAMNDENDYMQWFIYPPEDRWFLSEDYDIALERRAVLNSVQSAWFHKSRKATAKEIIKHFS